MAGNTWDVPVGNALIFPKILNDVRIASRRPDPIFQYQPPARRWDDGQIRNHQIEICEVLVVMAKTTATTKRQESDKYNDMS